MTTSPSTWAARSLLWLKNSIWAEKPRVDLFNVIPSAGSHNPRIRTTGFLGPALGKSSFDNLNRPGVAQPAKMRIADEAASRVSHRVIIRTPRGHFWKAISCPYFSKTDISHGSNAGFQC